MVKGHWRIAACVGLAAFAGTLAFAQLPANLPKIDMSKKMAEVPTETLVAKFAAPAESANPKVEPGKIRWHKTFDEACKASTASKKPVLLLHMMGNLDDLFC